MAAGATLLAGCGDVAFEAKPVGLAAGVHGKGSQDLYVDVTTGAGGTVQCEPACGKWTAGESPFPTGPVRAPVPLDPRRGEQTYRITVSQGLFKKTTRSFTYDYEPNVLVQPGGERDTFTVQCYLADCDGRLTVGDAVTLEVRAPGATRVSFGTESASPKDGKATLILSPTPYAGEQELGALNGSATRMAGAHFPLKLDLKIELSDTTLAASQEVNAPASAVRASFANVQAKPVVFLDDKPAPARPRTLVVVDDDSIDAVVGDVTKMRDIDLVAVEQASKRKVDCGYYASGGKSTHVVLDATDADVAVYDRRTGRQVARRSFSAGYSCGEKLRAIDDPSNELVLLVDADTIKTWLKTQVGG